MQRIDKGAEPTCMGELRQEARRIEEDTGKTLAPDDWSHIPTAEQKAAMQAALYIEQHGLCAYCQRRIHPRRGAKPATMRIEHLIPRAKAPERMFEWGNVIGVCDGLTEGASHCDRLRGCQPLTVSPLRATVEQQVQLGKARVLASKPAAGVIPVVSSNPAIQEDLDHTLGLNHRLLGNRRYEIRRTLRNKARDKGNKHGPVRARRFVKDRLAEATTVTPGRLRPPCARVIAEYCAGKLRSWS